MRYADRARAVPLTVAGELRCPRCGKPVDPWPLRRPDNCGLGMRICMRQIGAVFQGWRDAGYLRLPRVVTIGGRFL